MIPGKKPLTHAQIMTWDLPPVVWDVEGLISRGDRVVAFGEFGAGKTWIAQHLALHLAAGRHWLGYPIPEPRRVLYVDEEMNPRTTRRRIHRLTTGMTVTSGLPPGTLLPLTVLSRGGVLFHDKGASEVLGWMRGNGVEADVVFIDSMRRTLEGDENFAADIIKFWRNLERLAAGRTIIIIHHMNKPPKDTVVDVRYRASGSTDILAGSDASLAISRGEAKGQAWVEGVKARDTEEADQFGVGWRGQTGDDGKEDPQGPMYLRRLEKKRGPESFFGPGAQAGGNP